MLANDLSVDPGLDRTSLYESMTRRGNHRGSRNVPFANRKFHSDDQRGLRALSRRYIFVDFRFFQKYKRKEGRL